MFKNIRINSAESDVVAFFKTAKESLTRLKYQAITYGLAHSGSRGLLGIGVSSVAWGLKNAETVTGKVTAAAGGMAILASWGLFRLERHAENKISESIESCIDNYDEFNYAARFKKDHPIEVYAQTMTNAGRDFVGAGVLPLCVWYGLSQPALAGKVMGGAFLLGTIFWGYNAIQNLKTARCTTAEMMGSVTKYVKEKGYDIT